MFLSIFTREKHISHGRFRQVWDENGTIFMIILCGKYVFTIASSYHECCAILSRLQRHKTHFQFQNKTKQNTNIEHEL